MRFGFDLHQYLVPEWASFYVPYNSLKISFKAIVEKSISENTQPDFSELYTSIGTSIDNLKDFHQQQCNFLFKVHTEISIKHGPAPDSHHSLRILPASSGEKQNACIALESLRRNVEKLQSFYRVNKQAVDKIYGKIEKRGGSLGELHQEHKFKWTKLNIYLQGELSKLNIISAEFVTGAMCVLCHEASSKRPVHSAAEISALIPAIQNDEPCTLAKILEASPVKDALTSKNGTLFYQLVESSVMHHSRQSTRYLLSNAVSMTGVMPDHNLLNLLITRVGPRHRHLGKLQPIQIKQSLGTCRDESEECPLVIAVGQVYHDQNNIILATDNLGRLSLHYSALYGLDTVCQTIVHHAHAWKQGQASCLIFYLDSQGYTPFHYAVVENHVAVAMVFINILILENQLSGEPDKNTMSNMQNLLNIAIRYQLDEMVELLGEYQLHFGGVLAHEESPLYVAAQIGRDDYLGILLRNGQTGNIDDSEALYGWSPLFIACIKGHRKAVEVLLHAGASQELCDLRGWYAKEHAALRGHFSLAELLKSWDRSQMTGGPASIPLIPSPTVGFPLPVNVDHVMVNIGTSQNGRHLEGVNLRMLSSDKTFTGMSSLIDMSVSVEGSVSHLVHVPVISDMGNEPFIFPVHDSSEVHLIFKFFNAGSSREGRELIGSAATLLRSEQDCFGPNRESIFRGRTIPILAKETLDLLGTVTFTFLIVKRPMKVRSPPPIDRYTPEQGIQVVGHRGLKLQNNILRVLRQLTFHEGSGQNTADWSHLQLGENTVESILSAAGQGASYVEFDVQLTRDLVPIVFHDFSLSESGTDVPIHDITFEQFMHASKLQSPSDESDLQLKIDSTRRTGNIDRHRHRSRSLTTTDMQETHHIHDRMKYTVDFKNKGFKPNTRGSFIHGPFTTLKELLVNMPESISFNVEIKYPRFHEAIEAGVAPVALEINLFVDRILDQLFHHAQGRKIIVSSFTPEICILLAVKQQTYPVMFITNAGKLPANDLESRACSLQAAVQFSKRWGLAGIVFASDILLLCPRLVGYVKQSGFTCGSYGPMNNVPENVRVQQAAGIQMLMADRVGVVSMVLNESHDY